MNNLTIRQLAEMFNVSERSIRMAMDVHRLRPDLDPALESGEMSIREAHRIATGETRVTVSAVIPAGTAAALDELADISGSTRSDIIRAALGEYVARRALAEVMAR